MSNVLSIYDPIWYAQEAMLALEKALGMATKVYRGYDRTPQQIGSTIQIRKPSTFTAQSAPSAAQDVVADYIPIALDQWYEVKFALTDQELTYTGERIINEHIRPAAYALADNIDQALTALYSYIPWIEVMGSPIAVADIVNGRKLMFNNEVPMKDPNNLWGMVNGTTEAEMLQLSAFTQWQGSGAAGATAQVEGELGRRFGYGWFANQNVAAHTAGTLTAGTALQLNANITAGDTSVVFKDSGGSLTGTVTAGDTFSIAGDTQEYSITADATAAGNLITVNVSPKIAADALASAVVTLVQTDSSGENLMFHRDFAALAMAPLSEMGNELGARIATVQDPITGLSLRSRVYYIGNSSVVHVALDVLYGVAILDANRAVRLQDA